MSRPSAPAAHPKHNSPPQEDPARLHERWLLLARVGWVVLALLIIGLNAGALPTYYTDLQTVCASGIHCPSGQLTSDGARSLHAIGLSPGLFALVQSTISIVSVAVWSLLATFLFWRRSTDRMALFAAYMLVIFGGAAYTDVLQEGLAPLSPGWFLLVGMLNIIGQVCFITFWFVFPSGRFVPRWTRWCVGLVTLLWAGNVFLPAGLIDENALLFNLPFLAMLGCVIFAQIYRYRRIATPRERQQTKWVVFGLVLALGGFGSLLIVGQVLVPSVADSAAGDIIFSVAVYVLIILIPVFIAIAILRSRLWDIDTIINKALVYGSLTGLLGTLYAGLIIGLASLMGTITRQATPNPLVLVIATLAIAALFQPLRKRLQAGIDRRFYRRKYDAEKTLAVFSATLRSEVDLAQMSEQLLAVVNETMHPAHVSLWLRQPAGYTRESDGNMT